MASQYYFPLSFMGFCMITTLLFKLTLEQSDNYIVHMDLSAMPKAFSDHHHHWYQATLDTVLTTTNDHSSSSGSGLIYSYNHVINGFSARLTLSELEALEKCQGYISSTKDFSIKRDTTHTPEFLGLNFNSGAWPMSKYGEGVIIGVIDSGVWPESESYGDAGMHSIPTRWKGACIADSQFNTSLCNKKLIGARVFNKGIAASLKNVSISMNTTRDTHGHGTHTSSTAAGNFVNNASYFGFAAGTAKGVAPRAHLAIYKASFREDTLPSDVIAAIDQAIEDGVDVLSMSLGYNELALYEDPIALATFAAVKRGIFVSTSAGNDGPFFKTLHNGTPWVLTVAAGTVDRKFESNKTFLETKPAPTVTDYSSRGPSPNCPFVLKPDIMGPGNEVLAAWPSNIAVGDGFTNYNLLSGTSMACPHLTGVAALLKSAYPTWSPAAIRSAMMSTADLIDNTENPITDAGTSFKPASPLAMGAGQVNPNKAMEPGLIYDLNVNDYVNLLCGLNYTTKQIQTITRSSTTNCSSPSLDLNYPSFIAFFNSNDSMSNTTTALKEFQRTVTNVGEGISTYIAKVPQLKDLKVSVTPDRLVFREVNEKQSYKLTIEGPRKMKEKEVFGFLIWEESGGKYVVKTPIVVTSLGSHIAG